MRPLTENEVNSFFESVNVTSYKLLKEVMQEHVNAYDEIITRPITGIEGMFNQQQAIGAKTALMKILASHKEEITAALNKP